MISSFLYSTNSEPRNRANEISDLHEIRQSPDFKARKLWNVRSGASHNFSSIPIFPDSRIVRLMENKQAHLFSPLAFHHFPQKT